MSLCLSVTSRYSVETTEQIELVWGTHTPPAYNGLFLPKNCHFPWGSRPPSNVWFSGPTRVLNPNGISIDSAVSAGLTRVTDRSTDQQTDRQTTLLGR